MRPGSQTLRRPADHRQGAFAGLCIECALSHHDFLEVRTQAPGDSHSAEAPMPAAWIDGREHALIPSVGTEWMLCAECRMPKGCLYVPIP